MLDLEKKKETIIYNLAFVVEDIFLMLDLEKKKKRNDNLWSNIRVSLRLGV